MHRLLLAAVVLTAAAPRIASTQAFATNDAVLRRIWTVGMDSSQTYPLAQALLDSIGPRLTGTPGQKAANQWLLSKYRSWGIDAREASYGTWRGWRRGITHVDLVQPRVRSLEGMMLAWSPGTPRGAPMEAGVVAMPDIRTTAEFDAWLPQARGKFVLVSMAQPSCRPADNWREFAADTAQVRRLSDERARLQSAWNQRLMRATGDT